MPQTDLQFEEEFVLHEPHVRPTPRREIQLNYWSSSVPSGYRCCECGATPCKLWQDLSGRLLCAVHVAEHEHIDVHSLDARIQRLEQIGMLSPAVPDETDERTIMSYHEVSADGMCWWRNLATFPV